MNTMQKNIGIFSGGCAEFFWVYSLIQFISYIAGGKGLPAAICFVIFWVSVITTSLVRSRSLYVIVIVLLYAGLFGISLQWLFSVYFHQASEPLQYMSSPFYWIDILQESVTFMQWLPFIALSVCLILLWISGIYFPMKRMGYEGSLKTLEGGIVALFIIGLLQIALPGEVPGMNLFLSLFFVWSTISIMLNKTAYWGNEKNKGGRLFRWIFAFAFSICLIVVMIMTFFTDTLKWLAETGIYAAKTVSEPLVPILVYFLRLLFGGGNVREDPSSSNGSVLDSGLITEAVRDRSLFVEIMEKLFFLAVGFILLTIVITILGSILRFLFSKKGGASEQSQLTLRSLFQTAFRAIQAFLTYLARNIKSIAILWSRKDKAIVKIYKHLIRWGTIRGVYHEVYETPLEYVQKLTMKYTKHKDLFIQIVTAYYQEVYGNIQLDANEIAEIKRNFRILFIGKACEKVDDVPAI